MSLALNHRMTLQLGLRGRAVAVAARVILQVSELPDAANPKWTDDGLPGGKTKKYKVTAKAAGGGLSAPTGVTADPDAGAIDVYWQPVTGAEEYVVYHYDTAETEPAEPEHADESPFSAEVSATSYEAAQEWSLYNGVEHDTLVNLIVRAALRDLQALTLDAPASPITRTSQRTLLEPTYGAAATFFDEPLPPENLTLTEPA